MLAHILRRLIIWVPSVLLVMLGVYALGLGIPFLLVAAFIGQRLAFH